MSTLHTQQSQHAIKHIIWLAHKKTASSALTAKQGYINNSHNHDNSNGTLFDPIYWQWDWEKEYYSQPYSQNAHTDILSSQHPL